MKSYIIRFICIISSILSFAAVEASAEKFLDLYGGTNSTSKDNVKVNQQYLFSVPRSEIQNLNFDDSITIGGRFGKWLDQYPNFGIAGDISYFQLEDENAEFNVLPISLLFMMRFPLLPSENAPNGRLQPYFAAGPGLFFTDFEVELLDSYGQKVDEGSADLGLDLRSGIYWLIKENFGLFLEFRYTTVDVDYDSEDNWWPSIFYNVDVSADLQTTHLLGGLTFRY